MRENLNNRRLQSVHHLLKLMPSNIGSAGRRLGEAVEELIETRSAVRWSAHFAGRRKAKAAWRRWVGVAGGADCAIGREECRREGDADGRRRRRTVGRRLVGCRRERRCEGHTRRQVHLVHYLVILLHLQERKGTVSVVSCARFGKTLARRAPRFSFDLLDFNNGVFTQHQIGTQILERDWLVHYSFSWYWERWSTTRNCIDWEISLNNESSKQVRLHLRTQIFERDWFSAPYRINHSGWLKWSLDQWVTHLDLFIWILLPHSPSQWAL